MSVDFSIRLVVVWFSPLCLVYVVLVGMYVSCSELVKSAHSWSLLLGGFHA
jgi:hypothetical protein